MCLSYVLVCSCVHVQCVCVVCVGVSIFIMFLLLASIFLCFSSGIDRLVLVVRRVVFCLECQQPPNSEIDWRNSTTTTWASVCFALAAHLFLLQQHGGLLVERQVCNPTFAGLHQLSRLCIMIWNKLFMHSFIHPLQNVCSTTSEGLLRGAPNGQL